MWLSSKFKFIRVEFSLRHSAKAWQEKVGPWVQLLNQSNSGYSQSYPSREILRLLNQGMKDETSWDIHCGTEMSGMQYDLSKHQVAYELFWRDILMLNKLDHTLARKNDSPTWCGVIVVVWCYCGGVVLLWWCGVTVVVWCYCGSVFVVV